MAVCRQNLRLAIAHFKVLLVVLYGSQNNKLKGCASPYQLPEVIGVIDPVRLDRFIEFQEKSSLCCFLSDPFTNSYVVTS